MAPVIFSVGHSTRPPDERLDLLTQHGVAAIADVRRFPGSRRFPQFDSGQLAAALERIGICYMHFLELGGRRRSRAGGPNTAWRNGAFRGYADHMATPEFAAGLAALLALGAEAQVALLCSEALWWRCHRRLIADVLIVRGHPVEHILGRGPTIRHQLPPFACVEGRHITYPAGHNPAGAPEDSPSPSIDYGCGASEDKTRRSISATESTCL